MAANHELQNKLKLWLDSALKSANIGDFSVELEGNSGKGDGYIGDVKFVHVTGQTANLDLVLKCSKDSAKTREKMPIHEAFMTEINFLEHIVPAFSAFQLSKNVPESATLRHSVAQYYGKFLSPEKEVFAIENMKKHGFSMWDKRLPLTRNHVDLVVQEYAKFHAISVAMQDQKKAEFEELTKTYLMYDTYKKLFDDPSFTKMFRGVVENALEMLKGEVSPEYLAQLAEFPEKIKFLMFDNIDSRELSVVCHLDCWNNNYLFHSTNGKPEKVCILDWQLASVSSPICDLSYFLWAGRNEEVLRDVESVLKLYYEAFTKHASELGTDAAKLYPLPLFMKEFKKFSKYGIPFGLMLAKHALDDDDDYQDMTDVVESGKEVFDAFTGEIKYKEEFIKRAKAIVQIAGEKGFLLFE